ncbi:MarR family transcriptional regulator [Paraburkholderia sp. DHOC27]|nr:MarR family transcriptional regulator [Paraburkholderia sp. DHOC27]
MLGEMILKGDATTLESAEIDLFAEPVCTNTAVRRAARRLGNLYDAAFAAVGLKATQAGLLAGLDRLTTGNHGTPPTLQELASNLAIQISALTHALKPLVREGLVELRPDAQDGRAKRVALTASGTERLHAADLHWSTVNQRVEKVLGSESAAALRTLADRVASDSFLAAYDELLSQDTGAP